MSLEFLKEVDRAAVYKSGDLAAHLTRDESGVVTFEYTREWIRNSGRRVATTLPVTAGPLLCAAGSVPPFFAGLLPEGRRLIALQRGLKTSADDELTLLLGVGGDTVGDVQILPDGQPPRPVPPRLRVTSFDEVRFSDLLKTMGIRVDRVGVPGVQDKVSAAMLSLPVTAAGSHILLKLNPAEFKHLVENENFFVKAARLAGIRTTAAELVFDQEGSPGLAVARFDRVELGGTTRSLPVEDGCQVLGVHPASKYRVSSEALFRKLSSICEASIPAAADYLAQIAFAYLTGNGDAHAKNFSVLCDQDGRWQPTPAYDVPSSFFYGDSTMALPIDGRRDGNTTGGRFVALGESIGVHERAVVAIINRIADSADTWLDGADSLPFDRKRTVKFKRVVENRQRMLRQT